MDSAGRLIIPKPIREELHLKAGDSLEIESKSDQITLRPVRPQATLKKEQGVWVYQGEPADVSIPALIARERENRVQKLVE